jgi:hypothetical protein
LIFIRIWNIENKIKSTSIIPVKSKERRTRTKITTVSYSPDGKWGGHPLLPSYPHAMVSLISSMTAKLLFMDQKTAKLLFMD